MILHLLTDEQFTDYAIAQFSAPEMQSEFVLIPSNNEMWQVKLIDKCKIVEQDSPKFDALLNSLDKYSGVIFHGMHWGHWQKPILERVQKDVKVAWMFFGAEIYGRHDISDNFLAPITSLVNNFRRRVKRIGDTSKDYSWELPIELYQRIDVCLTDEKEEYEYAKRFLGNKMSYLWYNYYTLEETLGTLYDERCNGNNIIVGNSATINCNYFDIIPVIKRVLRPHQHVVLPLSYGSPWVRNYISKYAKFFLGNATMPLFEYMPRNEYNALLQSCSVMIMNHYHPQAQGNIITGIWLGMRVYLSERNMTYHYFKRIGCVVYSIENDLKEYGFTPMEEKDVEQNRTVLKQWYAKENMHKRNLEIVKALS